MSGLLLDKNGGAWAWRSWGGDGGGVEANRLRMRRSLRLLVCTTCTCAAAETIGEPVAQGRCTELGRNGNAGVVMTVACSGLRSDSPSEGGSPFDCMSTFNQSTHGSLIRLDALAGFSWRVGKMRISAVDSSSAGEPLLLDADLETTDGQPHKVPWPHLPTPPCHCS